MTSGFRTLVRSGLPSLVFKTMNSEAPLKGLFCPGLLSDMNSQKALMCEEYFKRKSLGFARFDYTNVGFSKSYSSRSDAVLVNLIQWRDDVFSIIDEVKGPMILIGSSMGGWMSVLAALRRPDLIKGLVLVAPSVDFLPAYVDAVLPYNLREDYLSGKYVSVEGPYGTVILQRDVIEASSVELDVYKKFWPDRKVPIKCPVRIIHGQNDDVVPFEHSLTLASRIETNDIDLILRKKGDHRMSTEEDFRLLSRTIDDVLGKVLPELCPQSIEFVQQQQDQQKQQEKFSL